MGAVKQVENQNTLNFIKINAEFPHILNEVTEIFGARLIHFSTDCVFGDGPGFFSELDKPGCTDIYGRSKLLGEITDSPFATTIRTSIVGRELKNKHGLLEWVLSSPEQIFGYSNAYFTGLSTSDVANVTIKIMGSDIDIFGLYHLAAVRISKLELLSLINEQFGLGKTIVPKKLDFEIDRSLNGKNFQIF